MAAQGVPPSELEFAAIQNQLTPLGLQIQKALVIVTLFFNQMQMPADGNCLFSSIHSQLQQLGLLNKVFFFVSHCPTLKACW